MSKSRSRRAESKAVALQYGVGDEAPVIVASGMGYLAEKIVDVAAEHGVPIYEDNSLSTVLTRLELGREIPPELYEAIVEIYVYFLHFDPVARAHEAQKAQAALEAQKAQEALEAQRAQEAAAAEGEERTHENN